MSVAGPNAGPRLAISILPKCEFHLLESRLGTLIGSLGNAELPTMQGLRSYIRKSMNENSKFVLYCLLSACCSPCDSAHHEAARGQLHPRQRALQAPLVVFRQTSAARHPGEGPLDDPPAVENGEPFVAINPRIWKTCIFSVSPRLKLSTKKGIEQDGTEI